MHLFQILSQKGSGPDRGVISQVARVAIDHLSDQRIDDPQGGGRTTVARGVPEARVEVEVLALLETIGPVVDRLAADMEEFGDPFDGLSLGKP
jgi:hypothetical protein